MSSFPGSENAIVLTFTANLDQARAAYRQFIDEVSRRPVPIQFGGDRGAGAPGGVAAVNQPGVGGGGFAAPSQLTGNVAGGAARPNFDTSRSFTTLGVTSAASAIDARIAQAREGELQAVERAARAEEARAARAERQAGMGGGGIPVLPGAGGRGAGPADDPHPIAARGRTAPAAAMAARGGRPRFTQGMFYSTMFGAFEAHQIMARHEQVQTQMQFAGGLSEYFTGQARDVQGLFGGMLSGMLGLGFDAAEMIGIGTGPTSVQRSFDISAERMKRIDEGRQALSAERIASQTRGAFTSAMATTGSLPAATRAMERAHIATSAQEQQKTLNQQISQLRQINAGMYNRPLSADELNILTSNQQNIIAKQRQVTESRRQAQFELQREATIHAEGLRIENIGLTGAAAAAGYEGARQPLQAQLSEINTAFDIRAAKADPSQRALIERARAAQIGAATSRYEFGLTQSALATEASGDVASLMARYQPLAAQMRQIRGQEAAALAGLPNDPTNPAVQRNRAAIMREADQQVRLHGIRFGDATFAQRAQLNVANAGLATLTSGQGNYTDRQLQAQFGGIYGNTLMQAMEAIQAGRPELVDPIRRHGQLSGQNVLQQYMAGLQPAEANLQRVATSDPSTTFDKLTEMLDKLDSVPSDLTAIRQLLQDFDKTI